MADIVSPTKVRLVVDLDGWHDHHREWLEAHQGQVVEGRMIGDDLFRPKGESMVLNEEEYEVVEGLTLEELRQQVWVRVSPEKNGLAVYDRCTKEGAESIDPSQAFYLMLMGCAVEFTLTDPQDNKARYKGRFTLDRCNA